MPRAVALRLVRGALPEGRFEPFIGKRTSPDSHHTVPHAKFVAECSKCGEETDIYCEGTRGTRYCKPCTDELYDAA